MKGAVILPRFLDVRVFYKAGILIVTLASSNSFEYIFRTIVVFYLTYEVVTSYLAALVVLKQSPAAFRVPHLPINYLLSNTVYK